ncbi:hypothetical protein L6Q96_03380 [Candidatus Binatia bacterium]|nr:hypothetical protein [Candidatus Binatia bacterium]
MRHLFRLSATVSRPLGLVALFVTLTHCSDGGSPPSSASPSEVPPYPYIAGTSAPPVPPADRLGAPAVTAPAIDTSQYKLPGSGGGDESNCSQWKTVNQTFFQWCTAYEDATVMQVVNLANAFHEATGEEYNFTGAFNFYIVDESGLLVRPDDFTRPSAALKQSLVGMFDALKTADLNWGSRLEFPLAGQSHFSPYPAPPSFDPQSRPSSTALDFAYPQFKLFYDLPEVSAAVLSRNPLALSAEFGGGGGFGCYVGTVDASGTAIDPPLIQFGGGFGFGLAEFDGVDSGYGGGVNLCSPPAGSFLAACVEDGTAWWGGGGGVNNSEVCGTGGPCEQTDTDLSGDMQVFNSQLRSGKAYNDLITADPRTIYVECGFGGGMGYQSRNNADPADRFLVQTFGFGGGGWSFFQLCRSRPDSCPAFDVSDFADQTASFFAGASGTAATKDRSVRRDSQAVVDVPPGLATRGVFTCDSTAPAKFAVARGLQFVYEPYHFFPTTGANPSCAPASTQGDPETTYIPGSTSPASLFLAANLTNYPAKTLLEADLAAIREVDVGGVVYAINLNPVWVDYTGAPAGLTTNINDMVLATLAGEGGEPIPTTLLVPLFLTPDDTSVAGQSPIVTANKELLDYAIQAAKTYPHVTGIMLGTATQGVIRGFAAACNGYNFNTDAMRARCGAYMQSLTFQNYYDLIAYLTGAIEDAAVGRTLAVGIDQSATNWLLQTSVSNSATLPKQSLLEYWTATIPNAVAAGSSVDLQPMVTIELVPELLGTPPVSLTFRDALAYLKETWEPLVSGGITAFGRPLVQTGWYGDDAAAFYEAFANCPGADPYSICDVQTAADLVFDELFDQPWKGLDPKSPGMPEAQCGFAFPVDHQVPDNPPGPPLPAALPNVCAPDFYNFDYAAGGQPEPPCLCLVNSTSYPVSFFGLVSDVATPDPSAIKTVPANRVLAYPKDASDDFYRKYVQGKDGAWNLGVTWKQFPLNISFLMDPDDPGKYEGAPVPSAASLTVNESLRCVGVSDAQNGAASANAGFYCPKVWFAQPDTLTRAYVDADGCANLTWALQGSGYELITGWLIKTVEAPAPTAVNPNIPTPAYAPIVMIPREDQRLEPANKMVSAGFRFCPDPNNPDPYYPFPTGLTTGSYYFEVKPLAGVPSTQAIDFGYLAIYGLKVEKTAQNPGPTDWTTLGKFTFEYPGSGSADMPNVGSIVFTLPNKKTLTFTPCVDNCAADFTLPGKKATGSDAAGLSYVTNMRMNFLQPVTVTLPDGTDGQVTACSVDLDITAGKNSGDDGGKAQVVGSVPLAPSYENCWLELQSGGFVNGGAFSFTLPASVLTAPTAVCVLDARAGDTEACANGIVTGRYDTSGKCTTATACAAAPCSGLWCNVVDALVPQPPPPPQ